MKNIKPMKSTLEEIRDAYVFYTFFSQLKTKDPASKQFIEEAYGSNFVDFLEIINYEFEEPADSIVALNNRIKELEAKLETLESNVLHSH